MTTGTGQGGKSYEDRLLAAELRSLTMNKIKSILQDDYPDVAFQKALLLRLAGNVLPRLNEHTGRDGENLPTPIVNVYANNRNSEDNQLN